MRRPLSRVGLLLGAFWLSAGAASGEATPLEGHAPAPARPASFEYLYIVANEGGSSGGHVAIRFDDEIYHFQNEDGLLVLQRDRAHEFLFDYVLQQNRTIRSARISTTGDVRARLRDRFRRRHLAGSSQLEVGRALRRDRELLEFLSKRGSARPALLSPELSGVSGLGYFTSVEAPVVNPSPALAELRDRITRRHGSAFFAERRLALSRQLQSLPTNELINWPIVPPVSIYEHPPFARPLSSRWVDARAGLAALGVLEQARPLRQNGYNAPEDADFALKDADIAALRLYANSLTTQLVDLTESRRTDWGQTLLVGMARLTALEMSIDRRRLVFLDTFPDDAARVFTEGRTDMEAMAIADNRSQYEASRAYFRKTAAPDELAWERLEERSNRYYELLRAVRNGSGFRVARGHLVPSLRAPYVVMTPTAQVDAQDIEQSRQREHDYTRALNDLHRYRIFTQNCATAIFETINDGVGGSMELSERHLGGHVGGPLSMAFVPFISADQVNERYRVVEVKTFRSYRQSRLREMRERESSAWVSVRESNTLTAQAYRRNPEDSFFVFFTEEPVLLRPLFGAVNLVAALGETALGLVAAPVDRGTMLVRGLRGAFVSVPEIAFWNIRKGTYAWVPKEHRDLEPEVAAIRSHQTY